MIALIIFLSCVVISIICYAYIQMKIFNEQTLFSFQKIEIVC